MFVALFGDDKFETDTKMPGFKRETMAYTADKQRRKGVRLEVDIDKKIGTVMHNTIDIE